MLKEKRNVCIICDSGKVKSKLVIGRDTKLKIYQCSNCLHQFQPISNYKDIYSSGEFSKIARNKSKTPSKIKIKSLESKALERLKFYNDMGLNSFDKIIEIGSSIGSFVSLMRRQGKNIDGLEPDKYYAEFSENFYGFSQHIDLIENFTPNKKFDSAVCFHVLEHVPNPNEFLINVKKNLKDSSNVIFEVPSMDLHYYGNYKKCYWSPHFHYFTISSLYYLFSNHFKVKKIGFYGISLFVFAESSDQNTFDKVKMDRFLKKSRLNSALVDQFPSISLGRFNKFAIKEIILRPFIDERPFDLIVDHIKAIWRNFKRISQLKSKNQ